MNISIYYPKNQMKYLRLLMKSLHLCRLQTLNKSQIVAFECEKYPGTLPGFFMYTEW